jgi:hypothetical protein
MIFYIHYNIWNKEKHIIPILEKIKEFVPKNSYLDFTFENIKDESLKIFEENKDEYLSDFNLQYFTSTEKYRMKNCNNSIDRFLNSDADIFLTPQDDQFFVSSNVFQDIKNLYQKEQNIGLVGLRDGFSRNHTNMYSSKFSVQNAMWIQWLEEGEYKLVDVVNDGPVVISKDTINKIGKFDAYNINAFYIEYDYCARCIKSGLNNYVLGSNIRHEKIGAIQSELYNQEFDFGRVDLDALHNNHPNFFFK